ncbi:MAG: hypothetical protein M1837_004472 [Sclerophora amabilis]|nr:MAG: hypothetical protein M1837_004472 [Sclerophora amabilis]
MENRMWTRTPKSVLKIPSKLDTIPGYVGSLRGKTSSTPDTTGIPSGVPEWEGADYDVSRGGQTQASSYASVGKDGRILDQVADQQPVPPLEKGCKTGRKLLHLNADEDHLDDLSISAPVETAISPTRQWMKTESGVDPVKQEDKKNQGERMPTGDVEGRKRLAITAIVKPDHDQKNKEAAKPGVQQEQKSDTAARPPHIDEEREQTKVTSVEIKPDFDDHRARKGPSSNDGNGQKTKEGAKPPPNDDVRDSADVAVMGGGETAWQEQRSSIATSAAQTPATTQEQNPKSALPAQPNQRSEGKRQARGKRKAVGEAAGADAGEEDETPEKTRLEETRAKRAKLAELNKDVDRSPAVRNTPDESKKSLSLREYDRKGNVVERSYKFPNEVDWTDGTSINALNKARSQWFRRLIGPKRIPFIPYAPEEEAFLIEAVRREQAEKNPINWVDFPRQFNARFEGTILPSVPGVKRPARSQASLQSHRTRLPEVKRIKNSVRFGGEESMTIADVEGESTIAGVEREQSTMDVVEEKESTTADVEEEDESTTATTITTATPTATTTTVLTRPRSEEVGESR